MKILTRIGLMLLFLFSFGSASFAADSLKVGIMDMQAFQQRSKAIQKLKNTFKKDFDKMQAELDKVNNEMVQLDQELKKQSMMLSLDARADKKSELAKKQRYYKYLYEDFTLQMKSEEAKMTRQINIEMEKVVKDLKLNEKYSIIIDKRTPGIIYWNEAIDVTDMIIKGYDRLIQ